MLNNDKRSLLTTNVSYTDHLKRTQNQTTVCPTISSITLLPKVSPVLVSVAAYFGLSFIFKRKSLRTFSSDTVFGN